MSYFNAEQEDWMRYLAALSPDEKCACGWNRRGECFNCRKEDGGNGYVERQAKKWAREHGLTANTSTRVEG